MTAAKNPAYLRVLHLRIPGILGEIMKVLEMPVLAGLLFVGLLRAAHADVYLHSPRGSNNRLNEQNVNRDNNNRLFDSQNNNKGGYTVGVDDDDYTNENLNVPDNGDAGYREFLESCIPCCRAAGALIADIPQGPRR